MRALVLENKNVFLLNDAVSEGSTPECDRMTWTFVLFWFDFFFFFWLVGPNMRYFCVQITIALAADNRVKIAATISTSEIWLC
jgi:hypothetical protein